MDKTDDISPEYLMGSWFGFFNEIGIINQLSSAMLTTHMPKDMTVSHFSVLNHLVRVQDGQTPAGLANAFQMPKTSMSHVLKGLVQRGYVDMAPDPEDGRGKQVWLTPPGRQFRDTTIQSLYADIKEASQHIDTGKVLDATPFLTEVRQFLDKARN